LAETKPKILAHPEVARAIEQDLIHALVVCLIGAKINEESAAKRHQALAMIRFEEVLAEHLTGLRHMPELCERVGVSTEHCGRLAPNFWLLAPPDVSCCAG